ncbi:MAG: zinc ribbon domain-containing protein [Verrucomicrobia bacterium]|nr:zinc ribbon domain-containing protein [Verrucomicrobiota bacterium]
MKSPDICPHCGAVVPEGATACPVCGSDARTGWSERATAQRLDLPDDEFDYDEFIRDEFGGPPHPRARPRGVRWFWWIVVVLVAAAFLLTVVG